MASKRKYPVIFSTLFTYEPNVFDISFNKFLLFKYKSICKFAKITQQAKYLRALNLMYFYL